MTSSVTLEAPRVSQCHGPCAGKRRRW